MASYYAEAYHVQAFRIDFERKEFKSCSDLMDKALDINNLSKHWKNTFHWYKGFYAYLDSDYESSVKHWNKTFHLKTILVNFLNTITGCLLLKVN